MKLNLFLHANKTELHIKKEQIRPIFQQASKLGSLVSITLHDVKIKKLWTFSEWLKNTWNDAQDYIVLYSMCQRKMWFFDGWGWGQ